jgi:hypothetical protein
MMFGLSAGSVGARHSELCFEVVRVGGSGGDVQMLFMTALAWV